MFLLHQEGGSPGKFSFSTIGGVKNCLREGDCVLEGQPMGIPPSPALPTYGQLPTPRLSPSPPPPPPRILFCLDQSGFLYIGPPLVSFLPSPPVFALCMGHFFLPSPLRSR